DNGDAWQLYRRMQPAILDALGTRGYFSPTIRRELQPDTSADVPPVVRVNVTPGPQSKVASLNIEFDGDINLPEFESRRNRLRSLWQLQLGQAFNQSEWSSSKDALLRDLLARDFAAATLAESLANVDPDRNLVELTVVYDSGPVFTFGELQITGLKKYPADLVERYNTIRPGDRYEQERLLDLLSALQNTTYFSSVDVKIDTDDRKPEQVPIEVTVLESDSKRLGLGAGYSSNTGFRTEATYQYNNLFERAYSLVTGLRLEQKRQSAYADVFLPPSRQGMTDSVGVALDYQQISNLEVDRSAVGAIRAFNVGVTDYQLGVNFQLEERRAFGINFGQTQALVASAAWTHNRVDDRLNPTDGYIASGQVAAASERFASDQDFVRLYGKLQHFWSPSKAHLFTARFELGTVAASARRDIPQDYLFRAGGTNSIRGFDFLDLGVLDQGVLVGGRRMAIGSLEYVRWLDGPLGAAVFTDIGDVADNWGALDPKPALGVGVRYKTPAGPIALDVAKAVDEDKIRIHFALGVAF
ncbi:MAG TPA: BamA/TamA family outer membrane protein, partial [Limnobacter sp.]|nr:BamA/TamA family outer membrane protein [Limnobacter sp.]